jgi:crotonobetainyl-CoA:carnitine CoA-transferase CaiB-like acyl-CoA transferase
MDTADSTQSAPKAGPLAGVRVLEMGRLIAAPFCAQVLGDLGADVIKIERAGLGDDVRGYGPPFLNGQSVAGASAYYLAMNRNKRSVAIDFSQPEGAELIRRLAATSDVFIENFKVGSLKKYGLDEASIRKLREDIVYLSVSGFGASGPYAHRPATDVVVQGMSGFMSVTGDPDGPPQKAGIPVADIVTGLYSAVGVISLLYEKQKTGRQGGWVGVSLLDSALAAMSTAATWSYLSGRPYMRAGNDAPESVPSGVFKCRDGEVLIQASKDPDFLKLCKVLGIEHVAQDPRFTTRAQRIANIVDMKRELDAAIGQWDRVALYNALVDVGVICGPINTVLDALQDPQVVANGVLKPALHPEDPNLQLVSSPIRFDDGAPGIRRHPPRVGEHTASVLEDLLGLDADSIADLERKKIISLMAR